MRAPTLTESLYLAAHGEYSDKLLVHRGALGAGLAGGWLCDLMLAGRLGLRQGCLVVVDARPTEDPSSKAVLAELASRPPADALRCVDLLAGDAYERVRHGMLAAGILEQVRTRRLGVLPGVRCRPADETTTTRVVTRMRHVALLEISDDAWSATLCWLVHTVRLWPQLVQEVPTDRVTPWLRRALADCDTTIGVVLSAVDTAVVRTAVGFTR